MSKTSALTKQLGIHKAKQDMQAELSVGNWTDREKVALACRILCSDGHDSGLAGQITAGDSEHGFLTQRLGVGLSEVRPSNMLRVDDELRVLEGSGMANPANRFHTWIYDARQDVRCIVHTHPRYASALSMIGVPLVISHMDSCALYEDVGYLSDWPGVPVGDEEGRLILTALGSKSAVLLAHHGVVTVGRSVEEACVLALQVERAAFLQITASSAGIIASLPREQGLEARDWLRTPVRMAATFAYYARRELAKAPECLA